MTNIPSSRAAMLHFTSLDFVSSLSSYDFAAQVTLQIDRLQGNSKHLPGQEVMDI